MYDGERALPCLIPSVWVTGQHDLDTQMVKGGYVTGTAADDDAIPPAVAAHAIACYTRPGALVLDPDCGGGTVVVEALRAGRHAIGLATGRGWRALARANVTAAKLLAAVRVHPRRDADPQDAATATVERLRAVLAQCRPLLRPGALVVLTARPWRYDGHLVDLTGRVLAAAMGTGLVPIQRCVALSAAIRGERLVNHAGLTARRSAARHHRATGHPICLPAHRDVLVFRARAIANAVAQASAPTVPSPPETGQPGSTRRAA